MLSIWIFKCVALHQFISCKYTFHSFSFSLDAAPQPAKYKELPDDLINTIICVMANMCRLACGLFHPASASLLQHNKQTTREFSQPLGLHRQVIHYVSCSTVLQ